MSFPVVFSFPYRYTVCHLENIENMAFFHHTYISTSNQKTNKKPERCPQKNPLGSSLRSSRYVIPYRSTMLTFVCLRLLIPGTNSKPHYHRTPHTGGLGGLAPTGKEAQTKATPTMPQSAIVLGIRAPKRSEQ